MSRPKKFVVSLSATDREKLKAIVSSGSSPARTITRARILLALNETDGPAPNRRAIGERLGVSEVTVYRVAKAFTESGGIAGEVVTRKKRTTPPAKPKVTSEVEAKVIALAGSQPPEDHPRWTLRLLEEYVAASQEIPSLDHSTIGKILKRVHLSLT